MKQKTPELGAQVRAQIADTLPTALAKAVRSYHNFMDDPYGENSSEFQKHHAACRAALAHIELLLKLSNMVDVSEQKNLNDISVLLQQAKSELIEVDGET